MNTFIWEAWKQYWATANPAWDKYNRIALKMGRRSEAALAAFEVYDEIVIAAGREWQKSWDKHARGFL